MRRAIGVSTALAALSVVFLAGCGKAHLVYRAAKLVVTPSEAEDPQAIEYAEDNCPFGSPDVQGNWDLGPTRMVAREGYVLMHSSTDKIPLWVCEHVTSEQLQGSAVRRNKFAPDPLLPVGTRAELADYKNSGYDRGHMAAAGNQARSQRLKDETFRLSNMAPQKGGLNQRIWRALEEKARDWAERRGEAFIITGPVFYDEAEEDPETADGLIPYYIIGDNAVAVPTHFFKIVVRPVGEDDWEAIGLVMANRGGYSSPYHLEDYRKPIDWIEEHTGLDFMPELSSVDQGRLEAATPDMWP